MGASLCGARVSIGANGWARDAFHWTRLHSPLYQWARCTSPMTTSACCAGETDEAEERPGWQDQQIAEALATSVPTVERTRKHFIEGGLDDALYHRPPAKAKPLEAVWPWGGESGRALVIVRHPRDEIGGRCNSWATRLSSCTAAQLSRMNSCGAHLKNFLKPHLKEQW